MPSGPVALLGSRVSRDSSISAVVKLTSQYRRQNIDAMSAGVEAVRVGVDTPSPTPIDMVSGKLVSLLLSLNTDQNLLGCYGGLNLEISLILFINSFPNKLM